MSNLGRIKLNEAVEKIKAGLKRTQIERVRTFSGQETQIEYSLDEIIGRGTFGVVVAVQDIATKQRMALKKVYQDRRYHNRELEILLALEHANIVRVFYFSCDERSEHGYFLNLFMEICDTSLDEIVARKKKLAQGEIRALFAQGLAALAYLESRGIAHRDVKPANLVLASGVLKICDFGSAKKIAKGEKNSIYICSRFYRAPENILGIADYDPKIDVWAMGLSFAELLLFRPLFAGDSNASQLAHILKIVDVADDLKKLHSLDAVKAPGIVAFLGPAVSCPELRFLFENSIVFDKQKRFSASQLLHRQ